MDVATLCNTYQRKMWNSMITRKKLNFSIWDAIHLKKELVFYIPYKSDHKFKVNTQRCLTCSTELIVGFRDNEFIVNCCKCANDPRAFATAEKLNTIFDSQQTANILSIFANHKTRNLQNKKSYWLSQGHSDNDTIDKIKEIQSIRSAKSPASQKGATKYSCRHIDFWIERGYSSDEASKQVARIQIGNGLSWYVDKYGIDDGTLKFNERISRWITSYNKALEKDPTINERKMCKLGRASGCSLKLFMPIYDLFNKQYKIYLGVDDNVEYFLRDGRTLYFYDFAIPTIKLIVEFHGKAFHPNRDLLSEHEFNEWSSLFSGQSAEVVLAKDNAKRLLAESRGFTYMIIWDTDNIETATRAITTVIESKNEA